jgi:hypothetical protein
MERRQIGQAVLGGLIALVVSISMIWFAAAHLLQGTPVKVPSRYGSGSKTVSPEVGAAILVVLAVLGLLNVAGHIKYLCSGRVRPFPNVFGLREDRRMRDQCVKCGYSRAGLRKDVACPECGAKVP